MLFNIFVGAKDSGLEALSAIFLTTPGCVCNCYAGGKGSRGTLIGSRPGESGESHEVQEGQVKGTARGSGKSLAQIEAVQRMD